MESLLGTLAQTGALGAMLAISLFGIYKLFKQHQATQERMINEQKRANQNQYELNKAIVERIGDQLTETHKKVREIHRVTVGGGDNGSRE
jgi:hypothetical protein